MDVGRIEVGLAAGLMPELPKNNAGQSGTRYGAPFPFWGLRDLELATGRLALRESDEIESTNELGRVDILTVRLDFYLSRDCNGISTTKGETAHLCNKVKRFLRKYATRSKTRAVRILSVRVHK